MSENKQKENILELPKTISVRQLAEMLDASAVDIIKTLMKQGIMANMNKQESDEEDS